jgi:hypothetical protein
MARRDNPHVRAWGATVCRVTPRPGADRPCPCFISGSPSRRLHRNPIRLHRPTTATISNLRGDGEGEGNKPQIAQISRILGQGHTARICTSTHVNVQPVSAYLLHVNHPSRTGQPQVSSDLRNLCNLWFAPCFLPSFSLFPLHRPHLLRVCNVRARRLSLLVAHNAQQVNSNQL